MCGQRRRVVTRQVLQIDCADPETAVKVFAAAKPDSERVMDLIEALRNPKGQAALIRKLSAMGIFPKKSSPGSKKI